MPNEREKKPLLVQEFLTKLSVLDVELMDHLLPTI
jgi:hypothetical protein